MKKLLKVLLSLLMTITLFGCQPQEVEKTVVTSEEFTQQMYDWFVEVMESDYITCHYGLEDASKFGIVFDEITLGDVLSDEDDNCKAEIALLESWDVSGLSEHEQLVYKKVLRYLQLQQEWLDYPNDYTFAYTPNSGVNNNLITNFTEFVIHNEDEAKAFITLVKDSKRYFEECNKYTKDQASKGIIQSSSVIDAVVEQVEKFIEKKEDNEVIRAFTESIKKLGLANEQDYIDQVKDAVLNYMIPAYESVIELYNEIEGTAEAKTISQYEDGKAYYELLFRSKASTNQSIEEVKEELLKGLKSAYRSYLRAAVSMEEPVEFGSNDPYEVLAELKAKMVNDFPVIEELDYTIAFLDPSVTSENISAYYLIAPFDNPNSNVIKVNPAFAEEGTSDFSMTLSHEGYPGHLYQHTYYLTQFPEDYISYCFDYLGWTEGWAKYSETYCLEYLCDDKMTKQYHDSYAKLSYYLYGYFDILVNYEGYTVSDLEKELSSLSLNSSIAQDLFDTIVGDPGMFLPYSVGLLKMSAFSAKAKTELGDKYTNLAYNKFLLDNGPIPFDMLEEELNKFIEINK